MPDLLEFKQPHDYLVRATAARGAIRAFAITSRATVEEARRLRNLSKTTTAALGRTLTAAAMMGPMMKGANDRLTLVFEGDGPIRTVVASAKPNGDVRGYVGDPTVELPLNAAGHLDVGGSIGRGTLRVTLDLGLGTPYSGNVDIQTGEVADDLAFYFTSSDQVPSAVGLGVLVWPDGHVREAGGFIIQLMPGAPDWVVDDLEEHLRGVKSVTDLLVEGQNPEQMLAHLLEGFDPEILSYMPVQYACDCNRERTDALMRLFGAGEIREMIEEGEPVTATCEFCGRDYIYGPADLRRLLGELVGTEPGSVR